MLEEATATPAERTAAQTAGTRGRPWSKGGLQQRGWLPSISLLTFVVVCTETPAKAQEHPTAPDRGEIQTILLRLDQAFSTSDLQAYQKEFTPLHQTAHSALMTRLGSIFNGQKKLTRTSSILAHRVQETFGIVHVQTQTRSEAQPRGAKPVQEDYLLVFSRHGDGSRLLLQTPVASDLLHDLSDSRFSCGACNYEVGSRKDWIPVPLEPARTGCLEAVTFFALHGDLRLEVSAHLRTRQVPAATLLATMLERKTRQPGLAGSAPTIEEWIPACFDQGLPEDITGARTRLENEEGLFTHLHLLCASKVSYLLVLTGKTADLVRLKDQAEEQLHSFRLLLPHCPEAEVRPLSGHARGIHLDDNRLHCARLRLSFQGPNGWTPTLELGPFLMRVVYQSSTGDRLRFTAYAPPPGASSWDRTHAEDLVARYCLGHGGERGGAEGFVPRLTPFPHDRLELSLKPRPSTQFRPPCMLTVVRCDDLLLVLEGHASTPAARKLVQAAFDSLRR